MITPFKQFNSKIIAKLNLLLHAFNKLNNMRGDEFIKVKRSGAGTTINMDLAKVRQRVAKNGGTGSGGSSVYGKTVRAECTQDAQGTAIITATLYESDGTVGDAISVYCNISNGTALNAAVPRLEDEDVIFVTKSIYDNAGTPTSRWYCVSNFQTSEDCTCGT